MRVKSTFILSGSLISSVQSNVKVCLGEDDPFHRSYVSCESYSKTLQKNIVNSLKLLQYECDVIEENFVDILERRCTKGHSLRCQKKKDMIKPRKNQQIIGESSCAISIG